MIKRFRQVNRDNRDKYFPLCPRLQKHVIVDLDGFCKENPKQDICEGCWSNDVIETTSE